MHHKVLVIGYGNSIRGDDAFGPLVAERLEQTLQADRVEVLSRHLLTPELAADVRDASLVIFIDASSDGPVGQTVCRRITAKLRPPNVKPCWMRPVTAVRAPLPGTPNLSL